MKKAKTWSSERRELLLETFTKGINLGIILLMSSFFILSVARSQEGIKLLTSHVILISTGYIMLGVLVKLLHLLPEFNLRWMRGMAVIYCLDILFFLLTAAISFFSAPIRYMALANLAVLLGFWAFDYYCLTAVAKALNHSPRTKRLVIDLKEKPESQEAFFRLLEDYCTANHISLTYITRDIPALVELDGVRHSVELNYYYSYGGPVYTMDLISAHPPVH